MDQLDVPLERDGFLRRLIGDLAMTLQDVVGLDDASGFISLVGQSVGRHIDQLYRSELQQETLDADQVGQVLVDLKSKIQGDFRIVESTSSQIVLANRACPFGEAVHGRPALCMMTSNVFGTITADNLGYARVDIQESIAQGAAGCRVVVHLSSEDGAGREYFGD